MLTEQTALRFRTYNRRPDEPEQPTIGPTPTERVGAAKAGADLSEPGKAGTVPTNDARLPGLQIARSDYRELGDLTTRYRDSNPSPAVAFLERELSRAMVVADRDIPPDVATLRSHLAFHDAITGRDWVVSLGHPADFLRREDAISVLSPLGAALIGLSEGQSIEFQTADGRDRRIALVRVLSQPPHLGRRSPGPLVP